MMLDAIRIKNGELEKDLSPILHSARPFAHHILCCKILHFQQSFVCREYAFALCYLAQLPVLAFNHVCRIDEFAYLWWEFEECGQLVPVVSP
jgi:hypothetical protein